MPTINQVHSCPWCDQPCSCENWSYGESCCDHCGGDAEESDAEPTSRSIDRENAAAINRDNKRGR